MLLRDKVAVVTGGAAGIGRALCQRFAAEGARAIVVADRDMVRAQQVAKEIGGLAVETDVGVESDLVHLVDKTTQQYGHVDLFCSNAGIVVEGGIETSNTDWQRIWGVNVMAHVYAARAVLPAMVTRGQGYLLQTASAAGLLSQIGSAPYSVTKHAAVAFAEWLGHSLREFGHWRVVSLPTWRAYRNARPSGRGHRLDVNRASDRARRRSGCRDPWISGRAVLDSAA